MGEIRYGRVSSVDPQCMTARVVFEDKGNMVSWDLLCITANSLENRDYWLPDVGKKVVCEIMDNENSQGFIKGAIYDTSNPSPRNNQDIRSVDFADGTVIEYNRASHVLNINCVGDINIKAAGKITINGATVDIN
ncbi:MAG: phage baseplate assembly protein V [Sporomusa sp.]